MENTGPVAPGPNRRRNPLFAPAFMYLTFAMVAVSQLYGPLPQFIADDLGVPVALVGQTLTLETILAAIAALSVSPLADTLGRRPVMLVAIALRIFGAALVFLYPSLPALFVGAAFLGIGNGIIFPQIFASVGDLFKSQRRDRMIALLLVASRIAFIVSPLASGVLAGAFGWPAAYAAGSLISVLALALTWLVTPRLVTRGESFANLVATVADSYRDLLGNRTIALLLAANVVFIAGAYGVDVYFGAFVAFSYGLAPERVGLLLTVGPVADMISTYISGRIPVRHRGKALVGAGLILFLPLAILFSFPLGPAFAVAMSAFWSLGLGLRATPFNATMLDLAPERLGGITGLMHVTYSIGTTIGSAFGGLALALGGYQAMGFVFSACTLLSAAMFAAASSRINSKTTG